MDDLIDEQTVRRCRAADPAEVGQRLRAARHGAGLTQGQLAEGLASIAHVSRIESGRRRADPALLAALAERVGLSLVDLVGPERDERDERDTSWELKADYAELALAAGNSDETLRLCAELAATPGLGTVVRRRVARLRARALEAAGDLRGSITALEELNSGAGRDLAWIKDIIALTRCYREAGEPTQAIRIAENAEGEIDRVGLSGTTEAIQLTVTVAMSHAELGDIQAAVELCRDAIDKADQINSPLARASAYWNASIFESRQGHNDAALQLARSALAEFERGEDSRNLGRLRSLIGQLLLRLDPPRASEALEVLGQARRELEWSSASVIDLARCDLFLARAHFLDDDLEAAQALLDSAGSTVRDAVPSAHADALVLAGEIAFATGHTTAARARFQEAAHVLTAMGADRSAGGYWIELATLFEAVGDSDGALTAYRSAAASAGLIGHTTRPRTRTHHHH